MGPNEEDIYVSQPDKWFVWERTQKFPLDGPHEDVGVRRGHTCTHSGTVSLQVCIVMKSEQVERKDELY